jgi:hypothetical protein
MGDDMVIFNLASNVKVLFDLFLQIRCHPSHCSEMLEPVVVVCIAFKNLFFPVVLSVVFAFSCGFPVFP